MRANPVVFFQPELYDTPCIRHGIEQPSIQTAVPKHRIETFIGPVLPGTTRVNVMGAHLLVSQPVLQDPGDQFRPIVTLDTGRFFFCFTMTCKPSWRRIRRTRSRPTRQPAWRNNTAIFR